MSDAAHAFLAPSGSPQWGPDGCPAAPTIQRQFPVDDDTPASREGTAAHFYLSETLSGRPCRVGDLAPNGHPIDKEMIDAAEGIVRDVRDTLAAASNGARLYIEARANGNGVIAAENWGTPDVQIVDFENRRFHSWDFKYGHRYVDAFENWQSVNYILLRLADLKIPASEWPLWSFTATIAQPRNYHPEGHLREWYFSGDKLGGYWSRLVDAAAKALEPNAPMVTGRYCLDCTAVHACPAAQRLGMALVDYSMTGQPIELPPHALGLELRIIREAIKRLEARAVGLEAQALGLVDKGVDVPFWKTDYSFGRTRWNDDVTVDALEVYGEIYGLPMTKTVPALTPREAQKAGLPQDVTKSLSHTPRGMKKLIPFDNKDAMKRFA